MSKNDPFIVHLHPQISLIAFFLFFQLFPNFLRSPCVDYKLPTLHDFLALASSISTLTIDNISIHRSPFISDYMASVTHNVVGN